MHLHPDQAQGEEESEGEEVRAEGVSCSSLVGDSVQLGDWRLIEERFPVEVIALHQNGSIRVRFEDGHELDGWPERTKPITNTSYTEQIEARAKK